MTSSRSGALHAVLLQLTLVVDTFILCEIAYRLYLGVEVLSVENVLEQEIAQHTNPVGPGETDLLLGWRVQECFAGRSGGPISSITP